MRLAEKALYFAMGAHYAVGQLRKYTNEPYIVHPIEVAEIVASVAPFDEEMLAAALLHDVVEDTKVHIFQIYTVFGQRVAQMVSELTNHSDPTMSRKDRKRLDRMRLAQAGYEVQTIKLADLISNTKSIRRHDPDFAKVYLAEKRALLAVMNAGNRALHAWATELSKE